MDNLKGPGQEHSPAITMPGSTVLPDTESIPHLLQSIAAQFELAMSRPEQVESDCIMVRRLLSLLPAASAKEHLLRLAPLLAKRLGPIAVPVFALLEEAAAASEDPGPLLEYMFMARDPNLARRALDLAEKLAESGSLPVDTKLARFLAERIEGEGSPLADPLQLAKIAKILDRLHIPGLDSLNPLQALFQSGSELKLRRLAARLLDIGGHPVPAGLAESLLGHDAYLFLRPYLDYTRISYLDLLFLVAGAGIPTKTLDSLREAEAVCGEVLLKDIIAKLGWPRLNLGLDVKHYAGISIHGSLPVMVFASEAPLLESCEDARRISESFLCIAHGGMAAEHRQETGSVDPISRFRSFNLSHADVLADILDLAPLTRTKVERILNLMGRIVGDFVALFASYTEECTILPGIYQDLRKRILIELENETPEPQLSAELTRLVQMFEDPRTLGGVRTLHGLKRYLHQKGLRLGMRLVEAGRGTNRTVDLLLVSRGRSPRPVRRIRYVDFDSESKDELEKACIPYPVALLLDGFCRQLLVGQESFPDVKIFCYGNEVHYYLSFKNHPAFLRIDYSPPQQGGMIDLEYYGVSKYELSAHPDLTLDAVRHFFRRLDYDIQIEQTRIHARYDKERAIDLGAVCEKAALLFRLVPYLMELDWVIGGFELNVEAKRAIAEAWASFFIQWGALPMAQLLSSDRRGILVEIESGPTGEREILWSGEGSYHDRYGGLIPSCSFMKPYALLEKAGLVDDSQAEDGDHAPWGQLALEQRILGPLREALKRGELVQTPDQFCRRPATQFQRVNETEIFAGILAADADRLLSAALVALLVAPLERTLQFHTAGTLNGHEIQHASLSLLGERLGLYVLRDSSSLIRLAFFARDPILYQSRQNTSALWTPNWSSNAADLALRLRRANYPDFGIKAAGGLTGEEAARIRTGFLQPNPMWRPRLIPGERLVTGLRASPGRAIGTVLFGTEKRVPDDLKGSVLAAASVRPEDNTFLYQAAGIVSTGGGILSHAGLLAVQFHKPALVIAGEWKRESDGSVTLLYQTQEYREEEGEFHGLKGCIFRDVCQREHRMREGDLVVLDATEGFLRVLGQDREALALHEGFGLFGEASRSLQHVTDAREILDLRGSRLRAQHQIEKLFSRLADPVLACHAVQELLMGKMLAGAVTASEKAQCLSVLLGNHNVGKIARTHLGQITAELIRRYRSQHEKASQLIPSSDSASEVLALRLDVLQLHRTLQGVSASLKACNFETDSLDSEKPPSVDDLTRRRLGELRRQSLSTLLQATSQSERNDRLRHTLRQVERLDLVLSTPEIEQKPVHQLAAQVALRDEVSLRECKSCRVVSPPNAGFEIHALIGWKAANLAEVERLGGRGLVPPWFVIAHQAFEDVFNSPLERIASGPEIIPPGVTNLREAIDAVLTRRDISHAQQSNLIRNLWNGIVHSPSLVEEVLSAYHNLGTDSPGDASPPFVAIRSSARAEDTEIAARAGEFETFLFVRGDQPLLEYLKRAWSGLWTERAIHNRSILGSGIEEIGGGVIVQRVVWSRAAGVLQTVNIAEGNLREMVINVGLGLGEGIVSGVVAADLILVSKEGDLARGPLRFRYITSDKRERVAFNERAGFGTTRVETLYHQRLRPALEYVELCELVRTASMLERAYGYPLDIEFAVEGTHLWILQARPVATFLSVLRETVEHHPLASP